MDLTGIKESWGTYKDTVKERPLITAIEFLFYWLVQTYLVVYFGRMFEWWSIQPDSNTAIISGALLAFVCQVISVDTWRGNPFEMSVKEYVVSRSMLLTLPFVGLFVAVMYLITNVKFWIGVLALIGLSAAYHHYF